jgi:hypothetical protein
MVIIQKGEVMKYPKINSLYKREGQGYTEEQLRNLTPEQKSTKGRFTDEYACGEFNAINLWRATEKIDGTNIRIECSQVYDSSKWLIELKGRTEKAQINPRLFQYLHGYFTEERIDKQFPETTNVTLYGEGHGDNIQNGQYYNEEPRFVLFDVLVNNKWWLGHNSMAQVANQLGIPHVPLLLTNVTKEQLENYVKTIPMSVFAKEKHPLEGIVATAAPVMLFRDGTPIKFKLKIKDFL